MEAMIDPDFGGNRTGTGRSRNILVIGDERHIVRLIQVNLQRAGYKIRTAATLAEAIELIAVERPDLIILSINLPESDQNEVLFKLRSQSEPGDIPIIILSKNRPDGDVLNSWQAGTIEVLTVPFNPTELFVMISRLLSTRR